MRYVVTGGAGFIGSSLVRRLIEKPGAEVAIIDNLSAGKLANLGGVRDSVQLHTVDIRNYDEIASVIRGADTVFHLAAIPSVPRSIVDPIPSHEVNINGTFLVLRAAHEGKVRRVVYAASSSAYGDTPVLPKIETMAPKPQSPYAVQKLVGEYYGGVFSAVYDLDVVALRYFNVFGPRQDPSSPYSGVLSRFIDAILERRAPTIYGDGGQTRDFTFVDDVARLNILASEAPHVGGKVINGGHGVRVSLLEAWDTLQKIEGVRIDPIFEPARSGDVRDSQADTGLCRELLGHKPQYTFEEGLRLTLDWYREQRRA